eukprot:12404947-Alexandrium_andersonii.AAC.1
MCIRDREATVASSSGAPATSRRTPWRRDRTRGIHNYYASVSGLCRVRGEPTAPTSVPAAAP